MIKIVANKRTVCSLLIASSLISSSIAGISPYTIQNAYAKTDASSVTSNNNNAKNDENDSNMPPEKPDNIADNTGTAPNAPKEDEKPPEKPASDDNNSPSDENGALPSRGANTMSYDYSGDYSSILTADNETSSLTGEDLASTDSSSNVLLARNGGTISSSGGTISKTGDLDDGDTANFYGTNSALLAVNDGSKIVSTKQTITTDATGANAVFATDSGTVYAKDDSLKTSKDNSRGLDATYNGTIIGDSLAISTSGDHCATIATDRGGGNVSLTNSTLSTSGSGSPLAYSTGNIQMRNVSGTSTSSQIAGIEGSNTILIRDSQLESNNQEKTASDPIPNGIIIYQSTSGDAEASNGTEQASFQALDSTLKSSIENGSMFYLTNTSADIVLDNTVIDYDSSQNELLSAKQNSSNNWGKEGNNGANVQLTGIKQKLEGNIMSGSGSSVHVYLTNNSEWNGHAIGDQDYPSDSNTVSVSVDPSSEWIVDDDSEVNDLNVISSESSIIDHSGKTVKIVSSDGKVLRDGDSNVTLTVTGEYDDSWNGTGASELNGNAIDRSKFDTEMGIATQWSMTDDVPSSESVSTDNTNIENADIWNMITGFFSRILEFFGIRR